MEDEHTKNYVRLTQEREAELALSLVHPNIVRCLGTLTANEGADRRAAGATGGHGGDVEGDSLAFLVFEHVPGTLLDLLQERPGGLTLPEVCGISHFSFVVCWCTTTLNARQNPTFLCRCPETKPVIVVTRVVLTQENWRPCNAQPNPPSQYFDSRVREEVFCNR